MCSSDHETKATETATDFVHTPSSPPTIDLVSSGRPRRRYLSPLAPGFYQRRSRRHGGLVGSPSPVHPSSSSPCACGGAAAAIPAIRPPEVQIGYIDAVL